MKRAVLLVSVFLLILQPAFGQTPVEEVRQATDAFFEAMRTADTLAVRNAFYPDATLQTAVADAETGVQVKTGSIDRFIKSIGSFPAGTMDERLYSYRIDVDSPLATAWTRYAFFFRGEPSHCGFNAFDWVKTNAGWKILRVIDTRNEDASCVDGLEEDPEQAVNAFLDEWHRAAASADENAYFGALDDDSVFLGTDTSERWTKAEFIEATGSAFSNDSAWDFKLIKRNLFFSDDGSTIWFEEWLDTWMGHARSTGVVKQNSDGFSIKHYHLTLPVPNDKLNAFKALLAK